jgi:VWFA-related protein
MLLRSNLIGALLAAALVPGLAAQTEQTPVYRAETRLVVLHASVLDKSGHLVTNLPESAFKVFENGVEQRLKVFRREDVPVSLGLIIDSSGSMRDKRAKVQASALQLVKASNPNDEVFVVNFNDEAYLDTPFTNDLKRMEEGLSRIDSRGGTAMRDAIGMSIDYLKEKGKKDKKVLVIVTDGNDNTSTLPLEKLVQKAQQSEVVMYAIGLLSEEDRREAGKAKRALNAVAEATGGAPFYPKELSEVERISLQVAHDIRNQYTLAYTPSEQTLDGSFRRISVTVNGPNHPVVRTRTGYYATPDLAARGPVAKAAQ